MIKPREYRNNNASETIDVRKVRKPVVGRYETINGVLTFIENRDHDTV